MSRNYQNHPELYPEVSSIHPDVHYLTNTMITETTANTMTTVNMQACLHTTARRLRSYRRFADSARESVAYEMALRVLLDEFFIEGDQWHALMYGPQGEDEQPCESAEDDGDLMAYKSIDVI